MASEQHTAGGTSGRRSDDGVVTRGGWTPTGTAAGRRANADRVSGSKAARTRQRLLDAARSAFARHGYLDTTVDHIVDEAGVARGSFYTYFESKVDIFRHLATQIDTDVIRQVVGFERAPEADPIASLEVANRNYLAVVRANADLYALVDQVASFDERVKKARLRSHQGHVGRVADSIRRWQRDGYADPAVDPDTTAAALVSMLSNFAYWLYVGGDSYDEDVAAATLTSVWVRACGLARTA